MSPRMMNSSPHMVNFSPRDVQIVNAKGLNTPYLAISCFLLIALFVGTFAGGVLVSLLAECTDGCTDCT